MLLTNTVRHTYGDQRSYFYCFQEDGTIASRYQVDFKDGSKYHWASDGCMLNVDS